MAVPLTWDIPDEIKARLSDQSGRQRTMVAEGHIVMVLHRAPRARDTRRDSSLFWRKPSGDWQCNQGKPGLVKLKQLVDDYNTAIVALEREYGRAYDAEARFKVLELVGPLFRAARNLYDTLQEARKAIPDARQRRELQGPCDVASDVYRAAELLQSDAKNALEFHIAKQGEIQSNLSRDLTQAGHRLNVMASIFLPLAAISGAFGMNLKHGLEWAPIWVFWLVLIGCVFLGVTGAVALLSSSGREHEKNLRRFPASSKEP
jgi:hypothetical protein